MTAPALSFVAWIPLAAMLISTGAVMAAEPAVETSTSGWRGNWTGLFPEADPPVEWSRKARSFVGAMACQAAKPAAGAGRSGEPITQGFVRDWLVLGPVTVGDSVREFDKPAVPNEADMQPDDGGAVGELKWKRFQVVRQPDYERWGTTELECVDLIEPLGYQSNQIAYAHTWLYTDQAGPVKVFIDHRNGLAAWVNGKLMYHSSTQAMGLGSYVGISRQKQESVINHSPGFEMTLEKGWNRLLIKLGSYNARDQRFFNFAMRLLDAAPVTYDDHNILWAADLGERTNATPIIAGDRIFTPAEPDELWCLDKTSGKMLWRAFNGLYDATPESERAANPAFAGKIDPLIAERARTTDIEPALALRRQISEGLIAIDSHRFKLKWDGHLASHFGIVGFTTTPVSDRRHVWSFYGNGVVACHDMDGHRQWIRRIDADEVRYSCSPALIGGKLVCVFGGMWGLDAATGVVLWHNEEATSTASLIPATIHGVDIVTDKGGNVYRAADGRKLWSNARLTGGDAGWSPAVILGDVMYQPMYGVNNLVIVNFSKVEGDEWKPVERVIETDSEHHRPDGKWWDRNTAGSPLIYKGRHYCIDQYGVFYAVDIATGKTLYRKDMGFDELHHYNAIGVGASATLGGKNIYVMDNQGMCVVIEPGDMYKQVAVNHIETLLPRVWPIGPQELLANAAPLFEGRRMYLRGERYLYCIGNPDDKSSK